MTKEEIILDLHKKMQSLTYSFDSRREMEIIFQSAYEKAIEETASERLKNMDESKLVSHEEMFKGVRERLFTDE